MFLFSIILFNIIKNGFLSSNLFPVMFAIHFLTNVFRDHMQYEVFVKKLQFYFHFSIFSEKNCLKYPKLVICLHKYWNERVCASASNNKTSALVYDVIVSIYGDSHDLWRFANNQANLFIHFFCCIFLLFAFKLQYICYEIYWKIDGCRGESLEWSGEINDKDILKIL